MMSRDSTISEADVSHTGEVSSTPIDPPGVIHQPLDSASPGVGSDKASRSNLSSKSGPGITPEDPNDASTESFKDGAIAISIAYNDPVGKTSDATFNAPIPTTSTTVSSTTTVTDTTTTTLFSRATSSGTTTTTTFSRRRSPPLRSQPLRPSMVLGRPTIGVNGHAVPRGAGDSRDAPRNPSALPTGPSDSTVRHTERLIGPVTASVAPPPLRISDAHRERGRLVSVSQRLMSRPVKRKLWEVDHDKLGPEIEKEYKQIIEEDQKRFQERWEELGPERNPDAPAFYRSEVTPSKRRNVGPQSSESAALPSKPSLSKPADNGNDDDAQQVSHVLESTSKTDPVDDDPGKLPPSSSLDDRKRVSKEALKQSETPSKVSPKKTAEGQVVDDIRPSETSSSKTSSLDSSPMELLNSSTIFSSSSSSKSDTSSLETTPSNKVTICPSPTGTSSQEETPRKSTPSKERITPPQRTSTRSSRHRLSSQKISPGPHSQKHLRM